MSSSHRTRNSIGSSQSKQVPHLDDDDDVTMQSRCPHRRNTRHRNTATATTLDSAATSLSPSFDNKSSISNGSSSYNNRHNSNNTRHQPNGGGAASLSSTRTPYLSKTSGTTASKATTRSAKTTGDITVTANTGFLKRDMEMPKHEFMRGLPRATPSASSKTKQQQQRRRQKQQQQQQQQYQNQNHHNDLHIHHSPSKNKTDRRDETPDTTVTTAETASVEEFQVPTEIVAHPMLADDVSTIADPADFHHDLNMQFTQFLAAQRRQLALQGQPVPTGLTAADIELFKAYLMNGSTNNRSNYNSSAGSQPNQYLPDIDRTTPMSNYPNQHHHHHYHGPPPTGGSYS